MIKLVETKNRNRSEYSVVVLDCDGNIISKRDLKANLYCVEYENFQYFVLYDSNMQVIKDVYEFLNVVMKNEPFTTRKNYAYALRLLFVYLDYTKQRIADLQDKDWREIYSFINGNFDDAVTFRDRSTVNHYFGIYKCFCERMGIKNEAIVATEENMFLLYGSEIKTKKSALLKKAIKANETTCPKFISMDEFKQLYELAINNDDTQTAIIMHLMFVYGLRLGEVLGLTFEDFSTTMNGDNIIYLRNRTSDKPFQYAKNLISPVNKAEYKTQDYKKSKHKINIYQQFYEELLIFLDEDHTTKSMKYKENYKETVADIIDASKCELDENHYCFLNRYGKRLSAQTWGNTLKKYFNEAGIPVDSLKRTDNLSHRFRHGFAMYQLYVLKTPVEKVQLLMRHKSPMSTMIYNNPTEEMEAKIKSEFVDEIYKTIPELRKGVGINNE